MNKRKFTRKEFLNYCMVLSGAALGASALSAIFKYLIPPKRGSDTDISKVTAAKVSQLSANSAKLFRFGDKPAILIKTAQGTLLAFDAVCTHLNCTVQYSPQNGDIWCACHNGHFDLTGKVVSGPPPRALGKYKVEVEGEDVIVLRS